MKTLYSVITCEGHLCVAVGLISHFLEPISIIVAYLFFIFIFQLFNYKQICFEIHLSLLKRSWILHIISSLRWKFTHAEWEREIFCVLQCSKVVIAAVKAVLCLQVASAAPLQPTPVGGTQSRCPLVVSTRIAFFLFLPPLLSPPIQICFYKKELKCYIDAVFFLEQHRSTEMKPDLKHRPRLCTDCDCIFKAVGWRL